MIFITLGFICLYINYNGGSATQLTTFVRLYCCNNNISLKMAGNPIET